MDQTTPFIYPGDEGSKLKPSSRYENFIGGDWQKPKSGKYFENISPTSDKRLPPALNQITIIKRTITTYTAGPAKFKNLFTRSTPCQNR